MSLDWHEPGLAQHGLGMVKEAAFSSTAASHVR